MKQAMAGSHFSRDRGMQLLRIARQAVLEVVGGQIFEPLEAAPWLKRPGATFVTLRQGKTLRGCVGSIEPYRPLLEDVRENACSAALRDPRFPPLSSAELHQTAVEVSVLSDLEPLPSMNEREVLERLRSGLDGVVLEYEGQRGTYLPQVWEMLPEPVDFLVRLKQKVGLDADFWHPEIQVWRYTVAKWCQADPPH